MPRFDKKKDKLLPIRSGGSMPDEVERSMIGSNISFSRLWDKNDLRTLAGDTALWIWVDSSLGGSEVRPETKDDLLGFSPDRQVPYFRFEP
jgi:hypothetical protein